MLFMAARCRAWIRSAHACVLLFLRGGVLPFYRLTIAALERCWHDRRRGHRTRWKRGWPISALLPLRFGADRLQYLVGSHWNLVDANAHRVENRISNCRRDGQLRPLPHFLCTERSVGVGFLDQIREDVAHLERRWAFVFEERREFMNEVAVAPVGHLFHQRFAKAHINAAFNLSHGQHGIDGLADVVRDPDTLYDNDSGFRIDLDFGDSRCTTEGRRWTNRGSFVFSWRCRRLVGSRRTERSILLFSKPDSVDEADTFLRILCIKNAPIREG